ncbi:MAG TPA: hypothetical protein VKW08_12710 [Xanthobacteraceae bacterium]|nr:hypothetical protein [Xanthobacteraceae bacterium]
MPISSLKTSAEAGPVRPVETNGGASRRITPLYVVCSPQRGVGKTLLARLLSEFYLMDGRQLAAFDLADEEPQLADFLPACTRIIDIDDASGQMALFDRILADGESVKVIDVSRRKFKDFFTIADRIGFFEEARAQAIEPLILFVIDSGPKSVNAYAILRRWVAAASLLPVRNHLVARGIPWSEQFRNRSAVPVSLDIPLLSGALRPLIEQPAFSFGKFWAAPPTTLPPRLDDELRAWIKRVFVQFREIELWLMCEEILSVLK